MKILRFDLLAYGTLTGSTLDLSGGHEGLHIIYGPNEAGKSTALRALTCMLYGFDSSCPDAHVHAYGDLRVGALLQGSDGRRVECIRRKGNKNTLRGPDDTSVIDSSQLEALLGRIDKESFSRRFGISHVELEQGGKQIAAGKGDLGESLFAAAAGTANLLGVRKQLNDEAGKLFKSGGQNPLVNKALREFNEQRRQVKELQVPLADWTNYLQACEEARKALADIEKALTQVEREKLRLVRYEQAFPDAGLRADVLSKLLEWEKVPRLDATFDERQRAARTAQEKAAERLRLAQGESDRIAGELAKLEAPSTLLAQRLEVEHLKETIGSVKKAQGDRPGLVAQRDQLEAEARDLWHELDPKLGSQRTPLRISAAERARLNTLVVEHPGLQATLAAAEHQLAELTGEIDALEKRLQGAAMPRDVSLLRRSVQTAEKMASVADELDEARLGEGALEARIKKALVQLSGWKGTAEDLLARPFPLPETIEQFRARLESAAEDVREWRRQSDGLAADLRNCDERAEELRLTHDAPTEEELAEARRARDEGFSHVAAWLRQGGAPTAAGTSFVSAFPPAADVTQAYELAVRRADELVDRMRREAAQVAAKSEIQAKRSRLKREGEYVNRELAAASAVEMETHAEWERLWKDWQIAPRTPAEMRAWREKASAIETLVHSRDEQAAAVAKQVEKLKLASSGLARALHELGAKTAPKADLADLLATANDLLEQSAAQAQSRKEIERDRVARREKLPGLTSAHDHAAQALVRWRTQWSEALSPLELASRTTPAEASAVLSLSAEIQLKVREGAELDARLAGIDRDAAAFAEQVNDFVARVAADLVGRGAFDAVDALSARLVVESNSAAQREGLVKAQDRFRDALTDAKRDLALAAKDLEFLCKEAKCEAVAELPIVANRAKDRVALEERLADVELRLRRCATGESLEAFLATVAAIPGDELQSQLRVASDQLTDLALQRDTARDRVNAAEWELAKIDGSAAAAEAQAAAEQAAANVCAGAEEYCRLQLAGAVLAKAVERYRDKNQGELLARASDLFQELTRGSFQGLRTDYNEAGAPILVGVRGGNKTLGVEAMSDGTRDQLYLALRLASVETHCRTPGLEPLPLVVDDVLIHFDDDRAAAALRALAQLAEHTQVVFFTHHEHLVKLARETLDDDVLFVQRLEGQGSAAPLAAGANRVEE